MQEALACLDDYWTKQGCVKLQPMNTEVGAGTMSPATFLRVLGPEPWHVAYAEPSVRPDDSRYGKNPNRIQTHTQYQVILKPEPGAQELYLGSLEALGIDVRAHDICFVEDNWASPALGAWGQGWEVWLDGLEITQFTYFQQAGGIVLDPVSVELTYGMERIMMALQDVRHFKEISYTDSLSYGELYGQAEYEMSRYYLDEADVAANRQLLTIYAGEARRLIAAGLPIPAYSYVLKCSHTFNVLDARGSVSTAERAAMFAQMRELSGDVARLWISTRAEQGHPLGIVAPLDPAAPASLPELSPASRPRDFALEVGTEEMAPSAAAMAREQFGRVGDDALAATRLNHGPVTVHATPRRLIAVVADVESRESDLVREVRGPKVEAAFDPAGNPTGAATGFARSNGASVADLGRVTVGSVEYLSFRRHEPGRSVAEALAATMSVAVASLHSAKNMRWRDPELSFNRPIRWILALWGDQVIPVSAGALTAGRSTRLLRTADKPLVEVRAAETLLGQLSQLSQAGLITDPAQRRELIETSSSRLAALAGGTVDLAAEAPLVDQLTYLIEEPNAILGQFDPGYLELPEGRSLLRPCRPWPDFLDSFAPDHKEGLEDGLRRRMGSDRSGYGPDAIGVLDRRAAVRLQR